jgi:hypothetical protein
MNYLLDNSSDYDVSDTLTQAAKQPTPQHYAPDIKSYQVKRMPFIHHLNQNIGMV